MQFGTTQGDVQQLNAKSCRSGFPHHSDSALAGESRFDSETRIAGEILPAAGDCFSCRYCGRKRRIRAIDSASDRIRIDKVGAPFEVHGCRERALTGAVWSGYHSENRHDSCGRGRQLAQDFVIRVPGGSGPEADLESFAARLL